jgi:hypothetical protein
MTREGMNLIERYVFNWHDAVPYFQWEPGQPLRIEWAFSDLVLATRRLGWLLTVLDHGTTYGVYFRSQDPPPVFLYADEVRVEDAVFNAALQIAQRLAEGK